MRTSFAAAPFAIALAGCTGVTLPDVDRLHDQIGARTVLREENFTLWSPIDLDGSRAWAERVGRELGAVEAAFDPALLAPKRLQVLLERIEMPVIPVATTREDHEIRIYQKASLNGVRGHAHEDIVVIYISPADRYRIGDGPELVVDTDPEELLGVLRHELGHIATNRAGLKLATWLSEGSADLVRSLEPRDGALVDVGAPPEFLEHARNLDRAEWGVERLLDWRERGGRIARGSESPDIPRRILCGLYVRWLLGLDGDGSPVRDLAVRVGDLSRRPRADLLAGEPAWRTWLEAQIADPAPPSAQGWHRPRR